MPSRNAAFATILCLALGGALGGCTTAAVDEEPEPGVKAGQIPPPAQQPVAAARSDELWLLPRLKQAGEPQGSAPDITYHSSATLSELIKFYRAQLKRKGWKEEKLQSDKKSVGNLWFNRKGERLSVSLGALSGTPHRVQVSLVPLGSAKLSDLPRYPGAKPLFADVSTAVYLTADPVEQVCAQVISQLSAAGWHGDALPPGPCRADTPDVPLTATLRKGNAVLEVMVAKAPAQNNRTTIQYALRAGK